MECPLLVSLRTADDDPQVVGQLARVCLRECGIQASLQRPPGRAEA
jgi:hypothetical protein